jgi:arsenate reductase
MNRPVVLFLCTNNAVRSQMAEAFLKKMAAEHFDAYSAGAEPTEIHPLTIRVMNEVGIDVNGQHSKHVRQFLGKLSVRIAVFVCPRTEEKCPIVWPGALAHLEWPFEDPAAYQGSEEDCLCKFRDVRDQIEQRITDWLAQVGVASGHPGKETLFTGGKP